MHINCHKEDLLKGVLAVSKGLSSKNTLPILNGILLICENKQLVMRATDLDIAVQTIIDCDIAEEGKVVVADGKRFLEIVKQLPNCDLSLSLINDYDLSINYKESSLVVRGFDSEQFPVFPSLESGVEGEITAEIFNRLVRQVASSASTDESRPVFTGILIDIKDNDIIMVANDTHRLNYSKGVWNKISGNNDKFIVPAKTMQEASKLCVANEKINIKISPNNIYFEGNNTLFISRLINGQYPDYNRVFPKDESFSAKVIINKKDFVETLSRSLLLARDNNSKITLHWQQNKVVITANAPDIGNIKEEIPVTLSGDDIICAYNVKYLLDAIRGAETDNIIWHLSSPLTPAVIKEENNDNYKALVLAIRIN